MNHPTRALGAAILFIALAAIASAAFAGVTTTIKPGDYALRQVMPDKSLKEGGRFATLDLCNAAIKTQGVAGEFRCDTSVQIKAVDDCVGVKPPTIALIKNAEGQWELPDAIAVQPDKADPTRWVTLQNLYVRSPAGAGACWVRGFADPNEWHLNGLSPAAPFLERKEPGVVYNDPPDVPEPIEWPADIQALWKNPVSVAARAANHIAYPDDP